MEDLRGLYDEFLEYMSAEKNASNMTIESYERDYKILEEFLTKNNISKDINNITTQVLRRYINYMKKDKNYCSTTLNRKINSLRSFAKFLVINEYEDVNFMNRITAPKKEKNFLKL